MDEVLSTLSVLNRDIMKELVGDDMEYIKKCEMDFIQQAQTIYNELVSLFKQGDFAKIKDRSHFLKTSSKAIGAEHLSYYLQTLENNSVESNRNECKVLIVKIGKAIKSVYEEIKRG